ncbi:MAG TPA: FAD-dependent monooxygenase [Burkholderiales bacterium]|nr:FAD-dependent monooxygenase [Burkholderiales bacterium]
MTATVDVLVRGAGPVGCVAALALRSKKRVAVLGKAGQPPAFRPIVLSYASRLILERVGVWPSLAPTPIETIRVSRTRGFGRTVFDAADAGVPALGYVLGYSELLRALHRVVEDLLVGDEVSARCVVHAEGTAPDAEEKRYAQDALVASVRFSAPAATTAFERFTAEGPLALLPRAGDYAVVWSMRPGRARELLSAAETRFLEQLAAAAGARPGRPVAVAARAMHPLVLRVRKKCIAERAVYIGNAAHTLHPVAGQGLNLGLRDAWDLARLMGSAPDAGDPALLRRFAAQRSVDAGAAIRVTDFLARAFLGLNPFAGAALTTLDILPAPRRFFARRMIFGPSALP